MATFGGSHQGILESLLSRLEVVTSRLEGVQVRDVLETGGIYEYLSLKLGVIDASVCREPQTEVLPLAVLRHQTLFLQLLLVARLRPQPQHQLQTTTV